MKGKKCYFTSENFTGRADADNCRRFRSVWTVFSLMPGRMRPEIKMSAADSSHLGRELVSLCIQKACLYGCVQPHWTQLTMHVQSVLIPPWRLCQSTSLPLLLLSKSTQAGLSYLYSPYALSVLNVHVLCVFPARWRWRWPRHGTVPLGSWPWTPWSHVSCALESSPWSRWPP